MHIPVALREKLQEVSTIQGLVQIIIQYVNHMPCAVGNIIYVQYLGVGRVSEVENR